MGVTQFLIEFDHDVFYPGQMITGKVHVSVDKPKEIRAVELKISGKAKCHWTSQESYTDSEGKTHWKTNNHDGKEKYMATKINLTPGYSQFIMPPGNHVYPFSVVLPSTSPGSYNGTYGSITYSGKAKLDIPMAFDKSEKKFFTVRHIMNLSKMPELKNPFKAEKSKTFCCWCCASGPLTIAVYLPKTGFSHTEEIPITVEVDNGSNVKVDSLKAKLHQNITWYASNDSKTEDNKLKSIEFGAVEEHNSATWSKSFQLGPETYPNTTGCDIIKIKYSLQIEADASGPHSDLDLFIPIAIGDVGCDDNEASSQFSSQNPTVVQPGFIPNSIPGIQPAFPTNPVVGMQPGPTPGFAYPTPSPNSMATYPQYPANGQNPSPVAPYPPSQNPTASFPPPAYGPMTDGNVYPNPSFNASGYPPTSSVTYGAPASNGLPYPSPMQQPAEAPAMSFPPPAASAPTPDN